MSPKKTRHQTGRKSRADLELEVSRLRAKIEALKVKADATINEDPNALPDVQEEGLPLGFRRQPGTARKASTAQRSTHPTTITIPLTPYVRSLFAKQRRGLGGFQSLHAALAHRMGGTKELVLSPTDFARVINYATNYGEGGFQQSLRWLVALWAQSNVAPAITGQID